MNEQVMTAKTPRVKPIGDQIIRVGRNLKGDLCVQIILNIPIAELFARELRKHSKEAKKQADAKHNSATSNLTQGQELGG